MDIWIVPCNIKKYDIIGAFRHLTAVDWKQTINAKTGDIVFIYVSKPIGAIIYKTKVTKPNLEKIEIDDSEYVLDGTGYVNAKRHMELELIDCFDVNKYHLEKIREHGIKGNIQGPMKVVDELIKYMQNQGNL